jgi:hypothetical protein
MNSLSGKRSGGSAACFVFCVLALALFAGLFVYPPSKKAAQLETEAEKIRAEIDTQNKLIPLYTRLLTTTRYEPADELRIPENKSLPTDRIANISSVFDAMANDCGLRLISSVPHPDFGEDKGRFLQVELSLQGRFSDFRNFLLMLGAMPELSHVQTIVIAKDKSYEKMEITLLLAVES